MARFRLRKPWRLGVLTVHVTTAVGWLGLTAALVALQLREGFIPDQGMCLFVMAPVALTAVASGTTLALGTPWGLTQYWWLLGKQSVAILLIALGTAVLLHRVAEPDLLATRWAGLGGLLAAVVLSVVKPGGRRKPAPIRGRHRQRIGLLAFLPHT